MSGSSALEVVEAHRAKLLKQGLCDRSFAVGVFNALATVFVVGRYPEHYWIFSATKSVGLFFVVFKRRWAAKEHLYLLDLCWVSNFVLTAFTLGTVFECVTGLGVSTPSLETKAWHLFFALGAGPLGWSVAVTGNALIFHSIDHTASLFIHSSPLLVTWTLRWHADRFYRAYPNLSTVSSSSLTLRPALQFYATWWLLYVTWLVSDGVNCPDRGLDTVFRSFDGPPLAKVAKMLGFSTTSVRPRAVIYMVAHASAVASSLAVSKLFYASFFAHTAFVLAMLSAAVWNGAKRYSLYLMLDAERKMLRRQQEKNQQDGPSSAEKASDDTKPR